MERKQRARTGRGLPGEKLRFNDMQGKYLYIHTIGCQMNVYDSDRLANGLIPRGFRLTDAMEDADVILVNTCSIRDKARQKAKSLIGRIGELKKEKPGILVGVGGCVAQQDGESILKSAPFVDLVFGTHAVGRVPEYVETILEIRQPVVDVEMAGVVDERGSHTAPPVDGRVTSFVTIMQGCDNFCTYCIVPHVRGREMSRPPERILEEIRCLVSGGVREVTLLGQNVNSYGIKEGLCSFPELLRRIDGIDGLWRMRFTTSHPKDLSEELIRCFGSLKTLAHHIHLPVQSGADGILKRMNRKYTVDAYLSLIRALRTQCPDMAITSDMIVGFPGETEADFEQTLALVEAVDFDGLFAFTYSDRPTAPAARFSEKVPEAVKKERLARLLAAQERHSRRRNRQCVGTVQEVLVEGPGRGRPASLGEPGPGTSQWTGRTLQNKIVNFESLPDQRGQGLPSAGILADVRIERALSHSLWGAPVRFRSEPEPMKGENDHAA